MAICKPGDTITAPPASIDGHVPRHAAGCAGPYGLNTVATPVDADGYTLDIDALHTLALEVRPKLITAGGSLNLFEHNVAAVRGIADEVGAKVLFDDAHTLAKLVAEALIRPVPEAMAGEVAQLRREFGKTHFICA